MLSRDAIHGRIEELEAEGYGLPDEHAGLIAKARNPSSWDAWLDITAEVMGADWRDLDADWWRAQFDRGHSIIAAIELWLEETA